MTPKTSISLRPHQRKAIKELRTGSILLSPVGSGKSLTSLYYVYTKVCGGSFEEPIRDPKNITLYIITTARKRDSLDWIKEAANLGIGPDSSIKLFVDSWNNLKKYVDISNQMFIFDEQRVVGYGAWSKSFIKIAKKNDWVLLTATPGDCWMDYVPVFIANGFYKNKTAFVREHVVFNSFVHFPKVDRYINENKLHRLRNLITVKMPFKRSVKKHHTFLFSEYDSEAMLRVVKDRWNIFKNKPITQAGDLCYTMRRVANSNPDRLLTVSMLATKYSKLIVFYNFNYELYLLRTLSDKFPIAEYNGHLHEQIPNTKSWIYLVQYTSGSEAWNCIETNAMLFFSLNYSYKTMHQAAGRIDRLNSPFENLHYFYLRTKSPIDDSITRALKRKTDFNEKSFIKSLA